MQRTRILSHAGLFLAMAWFLFCASSHTSAQDAALKGDYSTNHADKAACERHLNIIYGAIQEYGKQHGSKLPDKLSDLTLDFIHDPNVLICPFVQKRGGLRSWKKQFRELSPDTHTSYGYEFAPVPIDHNQWRGFPRKTWRDYKERVAQQLGPVVPIVRCHTHRPWLNLAIGGLIYESELLWERKFIKDDHLLTVANLFASPASTRPLTAADFPPRDPRAVERLLDLTAFYNAVLTNAWQGFPGNHLASLPAGLQEFGGLQFDIRGVIQLRGTHLAPEFPQRVSAIRVSQRCNRIHFLHALGFVYESATTSGLYTIQYADGRALEIPLICGKQIADWWLDAQNPTGPTEARVVWTGNNEAASAYGQSLCLYQFTWENPFKDSEVAAIGLDSGARAHTFAPFVVAITLE